MRRLSLVIVCGLFSSQVFAFGATTNAINNIATWGSTAGSSASSASTGLSKKDKVIEQAQNDAAVFVASKGNIRGAYLENALQHIRAIYPNTALNTDQALAEAILTY